MQRNLENLEAYKETCQKVMERAENMCEVMIDENNKACTNKPKRRCCKFITTEEVRYINFLHKDSRNGKSDEWILNPDNIVLGCAIHHQEEESIGIRVQSCEYSNVPIYLPEPDV